jgi:hypothetical protein
LKFAQTGPQRLSLKVRRDAQSEPLPFSQQRVIRDRAARAAIPVKSAISPQLEDAFKVLDDGEGANVRSALARNRASQIKQHRSALRAFAMAIRR